MSMEGGIIEKEVVKYREIASLLTRRKRQELRVCFLQRAHFLAQWGPSSDL